MPGERHEGRRILAITGGERVAFLQGLVSNDVGRVAEGLVYAALLTPQGKYLADFFLAQDGARLLLDVDAALAPDLERRLAMYRLRADVAIAPADDVTVLRGLGPPPPGAHPDPRHPTLGWRLHAPAGTPAAPPEIDWDRLRVAACIPESGRELVPGETFPLEAGFERLHGVDFRKGCYVGQEVTARMKHKTDLRKGLGLVTIDGPPPAPGAAIAAGDGRPVGTLHTVSGDRAIAYLRYDRADGDMHAGGAVLRRVEA